jgi:multidrug efflux pump subunit AcrA (membrane-fusion protein)
MIDGSDERLMPGMTVSCEIVVGMVEDTLFIPLDALFLRGGETIVYLQRRGGFEPRQIETGQEGNDLVVIAAGLEEGDRVALRDPTLELESMQELELAEENGQK